MRADMDTTPSKPACGNQTRPAASSEHLEQMRPDQKLKKPPPITPRRFTRFFTPRPRNPVNAVKTSRAALRAISGSALNTRSSRTIKSKATGTTQDAVTPRGKKRKLSFLIADTLPSSSPTQQLHELIRSSPTIPERRTPTRARSDSLDRYDTEDETDIAEDDDIEELENAAPVPRIIPYRSRTASGNILSSRLTGRKMRKEVFYSTRWQEETGHFYSHDHDVNNDFMRASAALPFSATPCHTNPLVAVGDEEGRIRLLDTSNSSENGISSTWLTIQPHDNALMDLEFSPDDKYLATASGDQSCQIIDMATQTSIYLLGDHRCSVKKIAFQPGSGNQVLASCGRDGQINFWDLRCKNTPRNHSTRRPSIALPMTQNMRSIAATHMVRDAHTAGIRSTVKDTRRKPNMVPGRSDFSITSLTFLGDSKPHLLVTASEIDSTIKVWDIRTSYGASRKAPSPLSITDEPKSHAHHRSFGVTSLVLNTDGSRLYSLSRDHTVYAYATSHLILGSSNQMSTKSKASRITDRHEGLGPLYGFRHPSMRIQTFWPRLAIRKATDSHTELLAVGSSDECAVLFPTDERYLNAGTKEIPSLHVPNPTKTSNTRSRPTLARSSSSSLSFSQKLTSSFTAANDESPLPIYQHGTPLVRAHDKEVTSLAWSSEGHLITASDDYTVRCWRENRERAREMRVAGEKNGIRWKKGWSDVGVPGFDDEF